jgi:hypothetical protein
MAGIVSIGSEGCDLCFRLVREADSTEEVRCRSEELSLSMDDVDVDRRRSINMTTGTFVVVVADEEEFDRRLEMGACVLSICFASRSSWSELSSWSVSFVSEG